jgi:hypothetical protein
MLVIDGIASSNSIIVGSGTGNSVTLVEVDWLSVAVLSRYITVGSRGTIGRIRESSVEPQPRGTNHPHANGLASRSTRR